MEASFDQPKRVFVKPKLVFKSGNWNPSESFSRANNLHHDNTYKDFTYNINKCGITHNRTDLTFK